MRGQRRGDRVPIEECFGTRTRDEVTPSSVIVRRWESQRKGTSSRGRMCGASTNRRARAPGNKSRRSRCRGTSHEGLWRQLGGRRMRLLVWRVNGHTVVLWELHRWRLLVVVLRIKGWLTR